MNAFVYVLIALHTAFALRGDSITNYFLVGDYLHFDSRRGYDPRDYPVPQLSIIVPIVDPDHLRAVRAEVALKPRLIPVANRDQLVFTLDIIPTPDGLNRNYDLPGFPEWAWHVAGLHAYWYSGVLTGIYPSVWDLECSARGTCPGRWPGIFEEPFFSRAELTFVEELGPHPLFVRYRFEEDTVRRIRLDWNVPPGGTSWSYTVEQQAGAAGAGWIPIPGITWPTTNSFFTFFLTNSNPILRVVARDAIP